MVDSRRDVAGQAGRSPSPSVQATMIGLMAILLWSLMTGLVRVVADAFKIFGHHNQVDGLFAVGGIGAD